MSTLARLLRLRLLLEEKSRMDLEKLGRHASRIDRAREKESDLASANRRGAFSLVVGSSDRQAGGNDNDGAAELPDLTAKETWMAAMTDGEIAARRQSGLDTLAQALAKQMEPAREEMLERHKERQQAETAVQNESAIRAVHLERARQRALDDWFAAMRCRRQRMESRRSSGS